MVYSKCSQQQDGFPDECSCLSCSPKGCTAEGPASAPSQRLHRGASADANSTLQLLLPCEAKFIPDRWKEFGGKETNVSQLFSPRRWSHP